MSDGTPDSQGAQLLPGESPDSPHADDIEHWVSVYRDLIKLIETATDALSRSDGDGGDRSVELCGSGEQCRREQLDRLHRRLRFWVARQEAAGVHRPAEGGALREPVQH